MPTSSNRQLPDEILETRAGRHFAALTLYPRATALVVSLALLSLTLFLPRLTRDTSSDAFLIPGHPSLEMRDRVRDIFGLADPVVVAIVDEQHPDGVFRPESLALVDRLTREIQSIEGVDPERVTSLATESDVIGTDDGMLVEPFFETPPESATAAKAVWQAVSDFPLYLGSLVARDGSATLIVAELLPGAEDGVYQRVLELTRNVETHGETLYVAGEGATKVYLGAYIDRDARRLNPLAALVISLILLVAFRTWRGVLIPNLVVLLSVAAALGAMAWAGVPFYVITNALPVLLIGVAVADSIHILGQYYEERARRPHAGSRELAVRSMVEMWRPVTVTTLTDSAGFLALAFSSTMPPMRAFGIFATLGVVAALLVSLVVVPNLLTLLEPRPSRALRRAVRGHGVDGIEPDGFSRILAGLGRAVVRRPGVVVGAGLAVVILGLVGVSRLQVDEERIANFKTSEPIYQADRAINRTLDGTNALDVMITTAEPEDLFRPEHLQRIEAFQRHLESLPHVGGTTSIVDYVKQMNRAVQEDRPDEYRIPDDPNLVAQYFLLYSASGDPTDLEEEIDYDYRLANVRVTLDTGRVSHITPVVEAAQEYIDQHFVDGAGIRAELGGRVNVDYHWLRALGSNHFLSLALALAAVWAMASIGFRSPVAGLFATAPVLVAVLSIYAVMGFAGIWLAVGTSMFAAIAIGTAVDFAIHLLDRLRELVRRGATIEGALAHLYPLTGRALLFNFAAVLLGFGVLTTSSVPPLIRFGSLVGVAVSVSFFASLTLLPALVLLTQPAFLRAPSSRDDRPVTAPSVPEAA